jgi:hypothetical protein
MLWECQASYGGEAGRPLGAREIMFRKVLAAVNGIF